MAEEMKTPAEPQAEPTQTQEPQAEPQKPEEQKPEEPKSEPQAEPQVKSKRDTLIEILKGEYPDDNMDDEETVFGRILEKRDKDGEKIAFWKEYNDRLMEDPKVATVLAELNAGTPFEVALAKYYDFENDFPKEGDTNFEAFAKARQGRIDAKKADDDRRTKFDGNIKDTDDRFIKWAASKGMDEATAREWFKKGPYKYFEGMADGSMPDDMFELFWKAEQYDKDIEGARAAGEVAGRNAKIEETMVPENDGMPTGSPEGTQAPEEKPKKRPYNPFIAGSGDYEL